MPLQDAPALIAALSVYLEELQPSDLQPYGQIMFFRRTPAYLVWLEYLKQDTEVRRFDQSLIMMGETFSSTSIDSLSYWLINTAMAKGAERAVQLLDTFISGNTTLSLEICLIQGLQVHQPCKLSPCLSLVPVLDVPSELFCQAYAEWQAHIRYQMENQPMGGWRNTFSTAIHPNCALVRRIETPGTLHAYEGGGAIIGWRGINDPEAQQVVDAISLLSTLGPSGPTLIGHWIEADDSVPLKGYLGGGLAILPLQELAPEVTTIESDQLVDFAELFKQYLALPDALRKSLQVPLQRLGAACRRRALVDKVIDLGIALEALLLNDSTPGAPLALQFRLRGALLLEPHDFVRRVRLERLMNRLYDMRSGAVHHGIVKPPGSLPNDEKLSEHELVKEALQLCVATIRLIIRMGRMPDWKSLILGGAP